ncbi:latent-transforming growth factor beta-binding protein 1 [Striga asiatica]|uniref:Latent-transforming growth factor beta-binding protein 1 n=1 Tax=Striga asiatica TaxID=4170 RepID=A0A5A7RG96_STRAF|nr:latent-transforming growth factor beta-binding protein 1 [Striga asiatica]
MTEHPSFSSNLRVTARLTSSASAKTTFRPWKKEFELEDSHRFSDMAVVEIDGRSWRPRAFLSPTAIEIPICSKRDNRRSSLQPCMANPNLNPDISTPVPRPSPPPLVRSSAPFVQKHTHHENTPSTAQQTTHHVQNYLKYPPLISHHVIRQAPVDLDSKIIASVGAQAFRQTRSLLH